MDNYFFDSSALVKRFISETGSGWTFRIIRPSSQNFIIISRITVVEVTAAISRRRKSGRISVIHANKAIARLNRDFLNRFIKVDISKLVIEEAREIAEKHYLRGYDAVQLASALQADKARKIKNLSALIFVSADNELNTAAQSEGLQIENPNNYP